MEQAASLAEATGKPVEDCEKLIEQVVFAEVFYPPKNYADTVNQACFDALLKFGNYDKCSYCGNRDDTCKSTIHGTIICESCAGYKGTPIINEKTRTGRNDPCPCGSGKKYKACCRV